MSAGNVRGSHGCDGLVIGGTTEARLVIDALNRAGFSLTVCVATELGKNVLSDVYGIFQTKICVGRKDQKGFEMIKQKMCPILKQNNTSYTVSNCFYTDK